MSVAVLFGISGILILPSFILKSTHSYSPTFRRWSMFLLLDNPFWSSLVPSMTKTLQGTYSIVEFVMFHWWSCDLLGHFHDDHYFVLWYRIRTSSAQFRHRLYHLLTLVYNRSLPFSLLFSQLSPRRELPSTLFLYLWGHTFLFRFSRRFSSHDTYSLMLDLFMFRHDRVYL